MKIYYNSYLGLGDNFYMRPFILNSAKEHEVYLATSFPELYENTNVKCVKPNTKLKTQAKNNEQHEFVELPQDINKEIKLSYHRGRLQGQTIIESFEHQTGYKTKRGDFKFDYSKLSPYVKFMLDETRNNTGKKICVVKLPTLRTEWAVLTRNPKMEYFQAIINKLKDEYFFISVADLTDEWFDGEEPTGIDEKFHHGELSISQYVALFGYADLILSYQSNALPIALSVETPIICLYGGFRKPEFHLHENMNLENYCEIAPDPFCDCNLTHHDCNKEIDEKEMMKKMDEFLQRRLL